MEVTPDSRTGAENCGGGGAGVRTRMGGGGGGGEREIREIREHIGR